MSTYIIAEAGVNHNGSLEMAYRLVDEAVRAGADAIKFQTFKAEKLVTATAKKAEYQQKHTDKEEKQLEMLKRLELTDQHHRLLKSYCEQKKIDFLSTPFDLESARFLIRDLGLETLKISSGDLTNSPLLLMIAREHKDIFLSTGMSSEDEINTALAILAFGYVNKSENPSPEAIMHAFQSSAGQKLLKEKVTILHCTTEYPTPFEDVNLRAVSFLKDTYQLRTGFSDHSQGIYMPIASVAIGVSVIEKHFTLDRNLPGPDHKASLEPDELVDMICAIRQVEKGMGEYKKVVTPSEHKNKGIARKSLVAAQDIKKGDIFTEENLTIKRPGSGVSPIRYWEWIGKKASRDYAEDEVIHDE